MMAVFLPALASLVGAFLCLHDTACRGTKAAAAPRPFPVLAMLLPCCALLHESWKDGMQPCMCNFPGRTEGRQSELLRP